VAGFPAAQSTARTFACCRSAGAPAGQGRAAILCAEAVPWRCHRSLIADALTVRGILVEHVLTEK